MSVPSYIDKTNEEVIADSLVRINLNLREITKLLHVITCHKTGEDYDLETDEDVKP